MRLANAIAAIAIVGLTGCLGPVKEEVEPEVLPPEIVACPPEQPTVELHGNPISCPEMQAVMEKATPCLQLERDGVQFTSGQDAIDAYKLCNSATKEVLRSFLYCRAMIESWRSGHDACVDEIRGLDE